jgi:hypothetical protein
VITLTERDDAQDRHMTLVRERRNVVKDIDRYVVAVKTAGDIQPLAAKLRELEQRRLAIDDEIRNLQPVPRLAPAIIEDRLAEWRRLLRGSTTQGRAVLQRVLHGRITFTPDDQGYTFEAPTRFDKLFSGIVVPRPAFIPAGGVPVHIGPEDTFDADYGQLLARASVATNTGKLNRAQQDSEPLATSERESRRFPKTAGRGFRTKVRKRAQQDSNLRPPGS